MVSKKSNLSKSNVRLKDYVEVDGTKYYVDNKKVVFETTKKELATAVWLSKKLNKKVEILPIVYQPEKIKTADYLIDSEKWDLKEITSNKNYAIYTRIRNQEKQASNFIFDISNSKLTIKSATKQVNELHKLKNFKWFKNVIIKKNNNIEYIKKS